MIVKISANKRNYQCGDVIIIPTEIKDFAYLVIAEEKDTYSLMDLECSCIPDKYRHINRQKIEDIIISGAEYVPSKYIMLSRVEDY